MQIRLESTWPESSRRKRIDFVCMVPDPELECHFDYVNTEDATLTLRRRSISGESHFEDSRIVRSHTASTRISAVRIRVRRPGV